MSSFIFPGDSKVKVNDFSKPRPIYFTGDGVSVAEDVNNNRFTITISGGGDVVSASNVGTGEGDVFKQLNVDDLEFKTIKAGTNITVTNNADDITISAAGSLLIYKLLYKMLFVISTEFKYVNTLGQVTYRYSSIFITVV